MSTVPSERTCTLDQHLEELRSLTPEKPDTYGEPESEGNFQLRMAKSERFGEIMRHLLETHEDEMRQRFYEVLARNQQPAASLIVGADLSDGRIVQP